MFIWRIEPKDSLSGEDRKEFKALTISYIAHEYIQYRKTLDIRIYNFTKSKNQKDKKSDMDTVDFDSFLSSYELILEYIKKDFISKSYIKDMKRLTYLLDEPLVARGKKLAEENKQNMEIFKVLDEISKNLTTVSKDIKKAELALDEEYRDLSNEELDELIKKEKDKNVKLKVRLAKKEKTLAEKKKTLAEKLEDLKTLRKQKKQLTKTLKVNGITVKQ